MNELIERCVDADGCREMEQEIKRRGLWLAYAAALTGDSKRPDGVAEQDEVLWGYSWERRRAAARQVAL